MADDKEDTFLPRAYGFKKLTETTAFYDEWAKTYEAELAKAGYVTPRRCAEALAQLDPSRSGPVADLGCGTGLAGLALRAVGFEPVDGLDFSAGMLDQARAHGCYRHLVQGDMSEPLALPEPHYAHAVASGVLVPGHAPAIAIRHSFATVKPGGFFVWTLNDKAAADPSYRVTSDALVDEGLAEQVFEEHGDHVPGIGLKASVIALRKLTA
ncbi:MAG: methyltransferase domain-containing protein [Pseudomonadota bacterium]